jgi:hypothetical protein
MFRIQLFSASQVAIQVPTRAVDHFHFRFKTRKLQDARLAPGSDTHRFKLRLLRESRAERKGVAQASATSSAGTDSPTSSLLLYQPFRCLLDAYSSQSHCPCARRPLTVRFPAAARTGESSTSVFYTNDMYHLAARRYIGRTTAIQRYVEGKYAAMFKAALMRTSRTYIRNMFVFIRRRIHDVMPPMSPLQ